MSGYDITHPTYTSVLRVLKNVLVEIKPDIIYTRSYSSWGGISSRLAKENNIPHVWSIAYDDDVKRTKMKSLIRRPLDILDNYYSNLSFKNATEIISQNKDLKRYGIKSQLITQSTTISNYNEINKAFDTLNIVWVANFRPIKQPNLFIELARIFENSTEINFIMIGSPDKEYSNLAKEADKFMSNFKYLGQLSNEIVNHYLNKSHILVSTSKGEGFSYTFVQGWMRGVVVLSLNSKS